MDETNGIEPPQAPEPSNLIDRGRLPAHYRCLPNGHQVIGPMTYPRGVLAAKIVIGAYRPERFRDFPHSDRTPFEVWSCATSRWVRLITTVENQLRIEDPTSLSSVRRGNVCRPAGYLTKMPEGRSAWYCQRPLCVHCHARSVGDLMKAILKARSRRPKGAKFYLGVVHVDGDEKDVARRWFKCHRTAGGVAFKYRGWGGEDYRWRNVIVAFSDSRQAMVKAGLRCVQRMRDRMAVTYFLARHLRYPRAWDQNRPVLALKSLAREYAKVKGVTRYRSYGACTDLYVPGMSWCDFTGYETKGTDQPG